MTKDSLCGAKTAGLNIEVQTLLPREKSRPIAFPGGKKYKVSFDHANHPSSKDLICSPAPRRR